MSQVKPQGSPDQVSFDPRHQKRIELMQALFAYSFADEIKSDNRVFADSTLKTVKQIMAQSEQIDSQLQTQATERPLAEINQVDLAILRLIMFEAINRNTPKKVLIDEAVELAKEFGSDSSPKFVNGVLGKLLMGN